MEEIKTALTNAGLIVEDINTQYVLIKDPACIFTAFDTFLDLAWIVVCVFTVLLLFGWGVLYIKNGVKLDSLSNNVKSLLLIFCVLSVVKPAMNVLYHRDDLFGQLCNTKQISMIEIQELLNSGNRNLNSTNRTMGNNNWPSYQESPNSYIAPPGYENNEGQSGQGVQNVNGSASQYNGSAWNLSGNRGEHSSNSRVTFFVNRDGELMKHTGGSRAWRNNNPGNIKYGTFARNNGATDSDGKFAIFPDAETGLSAISKLFRGKNYSSLSLSDAMHRYVSGADRSVSAKYAQFISNRTGISVNVKMEYMSDADLKKIALAIQQYEGWDTGIEEKVS